MQLRQEEREGEEPSRRASYRERRTRQAGTDAASHMERQPEGDLDVIHRPKVWTGTPATEPEEKKQARTKPTPRALEQPAEKIPDEVEVIDEQNEQRALDTGA